MWEILQLDFFNVGHSDAGLFSSWTNEQASRPDASSKDVACWKYSSAASTYCFGVIGSWFGSSINGVLRLAADA